MSLETKIRYLQITLVTIILLSYGLVLPDLSQGWNLTYEDSLIENVGSLAFLFTAFLFISFFFRSRKNEMTYTVFRRGNLIYLALGLLFFFAFGEEISWGQRLFGWQTPEHLKEINLQQETNLHNLEIFNQPREELKEKYGFLANFISFSPGRLFFYFWFIFLIIIPLLDRYSLKWQQRFKSLRVPIAPFWIGGLMIASYLLSKIFNRIVGHMYVSGYHTVDEFMEMDYAIVFAGLALYWSWTKIYLDRAKM